MINKIVERHNRLNPLTETEIQIVKAAANLFLEKGFSKTTHRMISAETGIGLGTITYHFKAKEDLLQLLLEAMMDYHLDVIENTLKETNDPFLSYALEIAVQIDICENHPTARDLYYAGYSHPTTFQFIKEWTSKKNYMLLGEKLPHLSESDFVALENIASAIEWSAFSFPCDRFFSLDDKVSMILDSMMKLYDIDPDIRKQTIEAILQLDYKSISKEVHGKFMERLYRKP